MADQPSALADFELDPPNDLGIEASATVAIALADAWTRINAALDRGRYVGDPGPKNRRERELIKTKLQEALLWANAAIAKESGFTK